MKNKLTLILAGLILMGMSSCVKSFLCIDGNGYIETELRRTGAFDQIENSTPCDVIYRKADTSGILISGDENIISHIVTEVSNNNLEIRTRPLGACFDYTQRPVITVTSPSLKKVLISGSGTFIGDELSGETVTLKISGSGDISVESITCSDLDVWLSGSGNIDIKEAHSENTDAFLSGSGIITMKGESINNHLKITGSGNIYADNFVTRSASVIISGSGNAYTYVEEKLNGIISGSGNIYVKGDPVIDQTVSGSGRIIKYR